MKNVVLASSIDYVTNLKVPQLSHFNQRFLVNAYGRGWGVFRDQL